MAYLPAHAVTTKHAPEANTYFHKKRQTQVTLPKPGGQPPQSSKPSRSNFSTVRSGTGDDGGIHTGEFSL